METSFSTCTRSISEEEKLNYFYLSDNSDIDSSILLIKTINEGSFQNIKEFESVVAESRLVGIIQRGLKKGLMISQELLKSKPQCLQMLQESRLFPVVMEDSGKFLICCLNIPYASIDCEKYNQLVAGITPFISELF